MSTMFRRFAAVAAAAVALPVVVIGIATGTAGAEPGQGGSTPPPTTVPAPPPPLCIRSLDINDRTVVEGTRTEANDAIYGYMTFTVSSNSCGRGGTVSYTTLPGTASAGGDYVSESGTLTFAAGSTANRYITIQIRRDGAPGDDETMHVVLHNPSSSLIDIDDGVGRGTIANDDYSCGPPPGLPPYLHPDYHCSE